MGEKEDLRGLGPPLLPVQILGQKKQKQKVTNLGGSG